MSFLARARALAWPAEPPTRDEWGVILLLGTAFLVSRYDFSLLSLALPDIQRNLGVPEDRLGAFLAYARLGAVAALPLALLADRIGRRRLLLATIVGFTVCSAASAFAPNWQVFATLQFVARAFTAADEILSVVVVLEEVTAKRRGWAVGVLAAFGGLGDGLAAALYPLAGVLPYGWRALYLLATAPLLFLVWLRQRLPETRHFTAATAAGIRPRDVSDALWAKPALLLALLAVSAAYHLPLSAALSIMSKHLQESFGYTPGQVALLFIGAGAFALLGNVVGGAVTDRIGRRTGFAFACFVMTLGFSGFYLGPAALAPFFWVLALFAFLASNVVFMTLSGELFPTVSRATTSMLMLAVGALASAAGLFAQGWFFTALGGQGYAVAALLPAFVAAGILALVALPETSGRDLADHAETALPQIQETPHADARGGARNERV